MKIGKLIYPVIIIGLLFSGQVLAVSSPAVVKARVDKILESRTLYRENGDEIRQQEVELIGLSGEYKGKILIYHGLGDLDVVSNRIYKVGDIVFVSVDYDSDGNQVVYITDYVRSRGLLWLLAIFIVVVLLIGGRIGWRSILALFLSFFLIMKFLAPLILKGGNPILIGSVSAFIILLLLVYITDGFNRKAHIAVLSILSALVLTISLSWFFVHLTNLSGTSSEETVFLIGDNIAVIDFQGLLLAAIIIGALGVLDDIAIGQVEAVEQLIINNPTQSRKRLFVSAMKIGRAHLGAIINTLFLAYVGASLPLVLLFNLKHEPFLSFSQVINNEEVATEIVRSLVGAIGLCLTMPIATGLSVWLLFKEKKLLN
ncbi:MAG TPA: YibE/F family protein [bacterium]|nr:YibE/F family protein [bacterium]